jgi:hypothetical protein
MSKQEIQEELRSTFFQQRKLVSRKIDSELLLFEEATNTAHCLNGIAGDMWLACERKSTAIEVTEFLRTQWPNMEKEVVCASLNKMVAAGLLEETTDQEIISTARRELIRKLGFTAAVAVPIVITSVLIPPAASAASCGHLLSPCGGSNPPCCSGFHCVVGVCEPL